MSLSFIKEIRPMPNYDANWTGIYEALNGLHRFVYIEERDEFVVAGVFTISGLGGVWMANLYFDGETGVYKYGLSAPWNLWQLLGYLKMIWSSGSYGKVYSVAISTFLPTYQIVQLDVDTRLPAIVMAIPCDEWDPAISPGPVSYCMERQEAIVVEAQTFGENRISIWNCSNPYVPVRKSTIDVPGIISNLCYENKELMWMITEDGIIAKLNYFLDSPRYEMLSSVQDPGGDTLGYNLTYDTKRKRVVVFRIRGDADGKNQSSIEFYRPYHVPSIITDPVPTGKVVGGYDVNFIGHLIGSAGEGVAGQIVAPSLLDGTQGQLLTNIAPTTVNGSFTVKYRVENALYADTLETECDVTDVFA